HAGISIEIRQAIRPSSHSPASVASGAPATGGRPVQFGMAVSRKPAIVAITKPNSISWMCQASGSKWLGTLLPVTNMTIQSNRANADHTPAARKNGRKPWVRKIAVPPLPTPHFDLHQPGHRRHAGYSAPPAGLAIGCEPGIQRPTDRGSSGRALIVKSQAISNA